MEIVTTEGTEVHHKEDEEDGGFVLFVLFVVNISVPSVPSVVNRQDGPASPRMRADRHAAATRNLTR